VGVRDTCVLGGVFIIEESTGLPNPFTDTWLDTMTQYDFRKKEWKTKHVPNGIGKTVDGGLIALDRVGEDGVLLFLGGERRDDDGTSGGVRSMETVWVYDIKSSIWYEQVTTGEIPVGRRQSCFFMVPAPDLSSYQIYTFSGTNAQEITLLDLYVLTVPGFIWKKISLTDAEYPDTYPINAHQCSPHKAGRQFLIVPGNMNASRNTTTFTYHCNNGTGIKVFDTLEWKFKPEFDPTLTTLGVPKPVVDLIGGTTSGGATVTAPKGGWQAKSLGTIFERRNEPVMHDDEVISPKPRPPNSVSKGAWVGIGVGALIGLICLGGLFYWWRCAFRGGKDEENPRPAELYAQQDPVEAQGYTVRQELSGGYYLPKVAYPPNPGEYQQHLGQENGGEGGPGVDPAGGAVAASSLVGSIKLDNQIHVHREGVYEDEPPISYEESMQGT